MGSMGAVLCLPLTGGAFIDVGMRQESGIWHFKSHVKLKAVPNYIKNIPHTTLRRKALEEEKLEVCGEGETHIWKDMPVTMALFTGLWSSSIDDLN